MAEMNVSEQPVDKAPPLTLENVLSVVKGVRNWRTLAKHLVRCYDKDDDENRGYRGATDLDALQREHDSDENCLKTVVRQFLQTGGRYSEASWRAVIWCLYKANEIQLADLIRSYSEQLEDDSLTVDNVTKVMEMVTADRIMKVWRWLDVPESLVKMITGNLSTTKEKTRARVDLYLNCSPEPSWKDITSALYVWDEMAAAREAKTFYHQNDPTLTVENLVGVMQKLTPDKKTRSEVWKKVLRSVYYNPDSYLDEVDTKYITEKEKTNVLADVYINSRPESSWEHLVKTLYETDAFTAAKEAKSFLQQNDPTLTVENVTQAMDMVTVDKIKRRLPWKRVLGDSAVQLIYGCYSGEEERLQYCSETYVTAKVNSSWEDLVKGMYFCGELTAAKNAKTFLQQKDPTLTVEKVAEVMEKVKVDKRRQVWGRVLTWEEKSPVDQLYSSHSTEKEKQHSCSDTYVNCHPEASWEHLTSRLYKEDEMTAVDQARPFLPPKDLTLTTDRLKGLFEPLEDPDRAGLLNICIGEEFGLPQSVVEQIKRSYQSTTQRKDAYLDAYTHRHPCPSWRKVADVLKWCQLYKQSEQVENTYVQVEEKSLVVPVKTEVKEKAVTVTKDEITSAQPTAAWDLCGVEVCGEMTVVVHSSGAQQITWEGFGLKLHIDDGSLPAGIHQCTLNIKSSLAGQYEFPDNSYLVSAIFWLRCEPMFKFTKPVTVEMQHCARSENVANLKLKFVRAVCSQKQLPYTFKEIGGDFTRHSSYGVVEVNGFSGLAITQEGSSACNYLTNLLSKEVKSHPTRVIFEIFFVVIRKMDSHRTVMLSHDHFKDAKLMTYQPIVFESDCVKFKIAKQSRNWKINELNSSIVTKEDVDSFTLHETSWIPHSHFKAKYVGDSSAIQDLECAVDIIGARRPHNKLTIDFSPEGPGPGVTIPSVDVPARPLPHYSQRRPSLHEVNMVEGKGKSVRVIDKVAYKWEEFAMMLHFEDDDIKRIQRECRGHDDSTRQASRQVIMEWKNGIGRQPATWATLIKALNEAKLSETAEELKFILED